MYKQSLQTLGLLHLYWHNKLQIYQMHAHNKSPQPKLVTQIEFLKNYYEHRKRVQQTLQRSPLNKSISYDNHKQMLHQYIKNRKEYTNNYNQTLRSNQMRNSKMVRNILDYRQKLFVFSLNKQTVVDTTLHHNSMVSTNKKNYSIDSENKRLHCRITKAKSQYSNLNPYKSLMSSTRNFYQQKQIGSSRKQSLNNHKLISEGSYLTQIPSDYVFGRTDIIQTEHYNQSGTLSRYKNGSSDLNGIKSSRMRVCERLRRQKLAQKLYEKKQKLQRSILCKTKIHS